MNNKLLHARCVHVCVIARCSLYNKSNSAEQGGLALFFICEKIWHNRKQTVEQCVGGECRKETPPPTYYTGHRSIIHSQWDRSTALLNHFSCLHENPDMCTIFLSPPAGPASPAEPRGRSGLAHTGPPCPSPSPGCPGSVPCCSTSTPPHVPPSWHSGNEQSHHEHSQAVIKSLQFTVYYLFSNESHMESPPRRVCMCVCTILTYVLFFNQE